MAMPVNPSGQRKGDNTAGQSPSSSVKSVASSPAIAAFPVQEKLIRDIQDCIREMKGDYEESGSPINDDNQNLHRFCAKLEHLLRNNMKEKYSMLGRKKDYWDYFCDCLGSTKGVNDGIKYVKTIGDYKTSVGKGRAFLRFCLMHNRMADSIQSCAMNGKVTSDWYNPKAVWLQHDKCNMVVNSLYDLSDLQFDLTPRGYDLDNAWPSFAKKSVGGVHNWNPPSRADSMSSLVSIPINENMSHRHGLSVSPSDSVNMTESIRSEMMDQIDALEQQKKTFQQSVVSTQGELQSLQDKHKQLVEHNQTVQAEHKDIQQRYDRLLLDMETKEKEWSMKENLLIKEQQSTENQLQKTHAQVTSLEEKLQQVESSRKDSDSGHMAKICDLEKSNSDLQLQIRILEQDLAASVESGKKNSDIIQTLETKLLTSERKNEELLLKLENSLDSKNMEATSHLDSANKLQEILLQLKEVETLKMKLEIEKDDLVKVNTGQKTEIEKLQTSAEEAKHDNESVIEGLKNDIKTLEIKLQNEEKKLEESNANLQKDIQTLCHAKNEEIQVEKLKIKEMTEKLELSYAKNSSLSEKLINSEKEFNDCIKSKNAEFETTLGIEKENVNKLQKTIEEAQNKVCATESMSNKLLEDIAAKDSENNDLKAQVQKSAQELVDLNQRLITAQRELQHSQEQRTLEKGTTEEIHIALEEKQNMIGKLEIQIQDMMGSVQVLAVQQDSYDTNQITNKDVQKNFIHSIGNICEVLQRRSEECKTASSENKALQKQCHDLQSELNTQGQKLLDLQTTSGETKTQFEITVNEMKARLDECEVVNKNKSEEIERLKEELKCKEEECSKLMENVDKLEKEVQDTRTDLETLKETLASEMSEKEQTREELTEISSSCALLKEEQKELENEMSIVVGKCNRFEEESKEKDQKLTDLNDRILKSEQLLILTLEERDQKVQMVSSLEKEIQRKTEELCSLQEQTSSMTEQIQQVSESFSSVSEERKSVQENLEKEIEAVRYKSQRIVELECSISNLEAQVEKKSKECQDVKRTLDEKLEKIQQIEKKLSDNDDDIKKLQDTLKNSEAERKKLEETKSKLDDKIKTLQTSIFDLEQKMSCQNQDFTDRCKDQKAVLDRLEKEREDLKVNLEEALSDLGSIKEQLNQTSNELDTAYSEKERVELEKNDMSRALSESESKIQELSDIRQTLETQIQENISVSEQNKKEIEERKEEIRKLMEELDVLREVEREKLKNDTEFDKERTQFGEVERQQKEKLQEMESKLLEQNDSYRELTEKVTSLKAEKDTLETTLTASKADMAEKKGLIETLESKVTSLNEDLEIIRQTLAETEERNQQTLNLSSAEVDTLKQEVSALQFQLSSEQMQHEQALQSYSTQDDSLQEMKEKILQQETLITELTSELEEIKVSRDKEKSGQVLQVDNLRHQLEEIKSDKTLLTEQLVEIRKALDSEKIQVATLQRKIQEQEELLQRSEKDKDIEISQLKEDTIQLKKKLIKLIKEKDSLWQKTDELAHQQKVQASEQWVDDKTIPNCMACSVQFSFTVRKHHCRLCGRVFCYNCSNNFINTTSSSKKSRVCDTCFSRKNQISGMNTSLLSNSDDDLEQSVDLPQTLNKSTRSNYSQDSSSTSTISGVTALDDEKSDTSSSVDMVPGQVAADISISLVNENETDEIKEGKAQSEINQAKSRSSSKDDAFHVLSEEEIAKSLTISQDSLPPADPNMTTSMAISADELENGEVNSSNEVWIKAGKSFAVPIVIDKPNISLCWEFSSQPKDVAFSVRFRRKKDQTSDLDTDLIPLCKCDSHKQAIKGELTAKQEGIYTLYFDNTYSRLTQKKVSYTLWTRYPS